MASTIIIITETAVVQGAEATPFITLHAIAIMVAAASSTPPAALAAAASHRKRIGPLAAYRYVPYACLHACACVTAYLQLSGKHDTRHKPAHKTTD